jgi:HK97 family phage portal protein
MDAPNQIATLDQGSDTRGSEARGSEIAAVFGDHVQRSGTYGTSGLNGLPSLAELLSSSGSIGITEALSQAAILACVDALSQDIAKPAFRLKERLRNGTSREVQPREHPVAALLATEPNRKHTWFEYLQMQVSYLAMASNCYSVVFRRRDGTPREIAPVVPGRVIDMTDPETGDTFYQVNASTMHERALLRAASLTVHEEDMIHVRARMLDGFSGHATLRAGKNVLAAGRSLDELRENLFSEEGLIRGVFVRDAPGSLSDDAFARLKTQLALLMRRFRKGGDPIVLEDKITFREIASNPAEMELARQFDQQVENACRLFRMPPHKVFLLNAVKYENLEAMEKAYADMTLLPLCRMIEQRHERALLTPQERTVFFLEFDRASLTVSDPKDLVERVQKLVERGVITRNEGRRMIGETPVIGGDTFTIPAKFNVLDENNTVIVGANSAKASNGQKPGASEAA